MKAKHGLLLKVGVSLLTIMLMGACNNAEEKKDQGTNQTEQNTGQNTEQSGSNQ
ncbi:hypothetical protein [Anoxybacteroides tepidamans]|uniref:hypothetical protein n=1 Tax=Anoxybacteroides tepidamans TaxID=265948 RepID=UPI000A6247F6|nr:hypothetical protein [Anoxybacillus tepidamans]